jgi:hypothetical protein
MKVYMKDAFSHRTTVIDRLHCPRQSFAANPGTDCVIFYVFVIRDRVVTGKQNQPIIALQRTKATKNKSDALRRKWMWSRQISDYSGVKVAA